MLFFKRNKNTVTKTIESTPKSRYLDKEENILWTPSNLLSKISQIFEITYTHQLEGRAKLAEEGWKAVKFLSEDAVLFGMPTAAYFLAVIYQNGYAGVEKDTYHAKLWLLLGSKFPLDELCSPIVNENNDRINLLEGFNETRESYTSLEPIIEKYWAAVYINMEGRQATDIVSTHDHVIATALFYKADEEHHLTVNGATDDIVDFYNNNPSTPNSCSVM